jgi:hypothetical protein
MDELRYVILRHDGIDEPHFDFMFEDASGSDLRSFRFPSWPLWEATEVTELRPHRRAYLTYEGEISGGRGSVQRVAEGNCQVARTAADQAWRVTLLGHADRTTLVLTPQAGSESIYIARPERF